MFEEVDWVMMGLDWMVTPLGFLIFFVAAAFLGFTYRYFTRKIGKKYGSDKNDLKIVFGLLIAVATILLIYFLINFIT